jgi:hypothetical protein
LAHFTTELKKHKSNHIEIYADLPSHNINGGTIPQDITQTALRPDLVLIERKAKKIHLLELTCSFETNIDAAYSRKYKNYTDLKSDLENSGWAVQLDPFEIGSRGHVTKRNKDTLMKTARHISLKINHKKLVSELSKISLLCSFSVYQAHSQPTWQSPPLLHP